LVHVRQVVPLGEIPSGAKQMGMMTMVDVVLYVIAFVVREDVNRYGNAYCENWSGGSGVWI
jgi:hypothetical protein